ncbi:C-5-cytosine methyltransferase [Pararheinheimera phage vB_PsoM_KLER1-1]|nr:C-5-cytosine methyltransferase [Pararheinheimera phage vB_PsoM_KLER1-1]
MSKGTIISLCDYTGIMVKPWVEAGYKAVLVDPQHSEYSLDNNIERIPLFLLNALSRLGEIIRTENVVFVAAFPPCTDVAVSGAAHFEAKAAKDKHFQAKAALVAEQCRTLGEVSGAPWFFENPVSVFASIFGKPNYTFDPYEYGGYLDEGDKHPEYPDIIAPRDAYPKKTCLWVGNDFLMPEKLPVPVRPGYSDQHHKLGGRSIKTKNIRSATPRGFATAVFLTNAPHIKNKDGSSVKEKPCT